MASKRMFDRELVNTDQFCDMPMTSQLLYFHLGMNADDEGFISPKRLMRGYGFSDDDLKILVAKSFVIPFKSGVVVITHWLENNYVNKTKIKPTLYLEERSELEITGNVYTKKLVGKGDNEKLAESWRKVGGKLAQYSIEENRVEESNIYTSPSSTTDKVKFLTLASFEKNKDTVITKVTELYPDKDVAKAYDKFVEGCKIKYKYKDYYLAFCKWVREDRFGEYKKTGNSKSAFDAIIAKRNK